MKYQLRKDERGGAIQYDHTVVFRFDSIESNFRVEENGTFSLPPGAEEKPFKLVEVKMEEPVTSDLTAISVVIQYEVDGETKTREIPVPQTK